MTRIVAVASSALLVVALGACSTPSVQSAPAPDLRAFLHPNYVVSSQISVPSIDGHPPMIAVVSTGPGLTAGSPVAGGTGDVQVLSYDDQAKRWVLALDASDQLNIVGSLDPATPLLDQIHPISDIRAQVVRFAGRPNPDLVISGLDASSNHPSYVAAIVRFGVGAAQLVWSSSDQGLITPVISGRPKAQVLRVTADYFTDGAPACCPVRTYQRTLGTDAQGNVVVTADSRPYLGVWLAPSDASASVNSGAVVVAVDPGSPATGQLRPGDVILGVNEPTTSSPPPALLDQVAHHLPGDKLLLRNNRSGLVMPVPVTLGSALSPAASSPGPGVGYLGIKADAAFQIVDGNQDSPLLVAGLQGGDTLKSINGVTLTRQTDLLIALWGTAGKEIKIVYVDSTGVSKTVTATPNELPQSEPPPTILHI